MCHWKVYINCSKAWIHFDLLYLSFFSLSSLSLSIYLSLASKMLLSNRQLPPSGLYMQCYHRWNLRIWCKNTFLFIFSCSCSVVSCLYVSLSASQFRDQSGFQSFGVAYFISIWLHLRFHICCLCAIFFFRGSFHECHAHGEWFSVLAITFIRYFVSFCICAVCWFVWALPN